MSTGSVGANWTSTSSSDTTPRYRKVWSGGDGRYETYAGSVRDKWNNFTCEIESRLCTKASMAWVRNNGTTFTLSSQTIPSHLPFTYTVTAAEQIKALDKVIAQYKGHQFNLAVNLGQMRQTVDMLSGTLRKLGGAFSATRRGVWKDAAAFFGTSKAPGGQKHFRANDLTGRWLELQYGWKPAIQDSYEAIKAFERISQGTRRAVFHSTVTRRITRENIGPTNGYRASGTFKRHITLEAYEEMSFLRQLGVLDPASLAWELLPYSFVIDWFIPIGTYLSNLNALPHIKGRWCVADVVTWPYQRMEFFIVPGPAATDPKQVIHIPDVRYNAKKVTRTVGVPTLPLPKFDTRGAIHGNRFWNALALASQQFGLNTLIDTANRSYRL
jgi:hypothetical protein